MQLIMSNQIIIRRTKERKNNTRRSGYSLRGKLIKHVKISFFIVLRVEYINISRGKEL